MKLLALLAKRRPRRSDLGRNDEGLGGPAQFLARRRDLVGAKRGAMRRRRALLVRRAERSEEHTSELQSLMRISYAVFCLKKKTTKQTMQAKDTNARRKQ